MCRYTLNTNELTQKHVVSIDKSSLTKWSEPRPPSWIKIKLWQYVIKYNLYEEAINFLVQISGKNDCKLIKHVLQHDFNGNCFANVSIQNLVALDLQLFDYICTFLNDMDTKSVQQTTSVTYPTTQFHIPVDSSYRRSFCILDLNRKSVSNFIDHVGKRMFAAQLIFSLNLFDCTKYQQLQLFLQTKIQILTKNSLNKPEIFSNKNNFDEKQLPLTKIDSSSFSSCFWHLPLQILCQSCNISTIIVLGCLNRYWYNLVFNDQFFNYYVTNQQFTLTSAKCKKYNKWLSTQWFLNNIVIFDCQASIVDITSCSFPLLTLNKIQLLSGKVLHIQKFPKTLKVVCVEANNKTLGHGIEFKPLQVWQHPITLLVINNDTSYNVPQYKHMNKILWNSCIVTPENIVDAILNTHVWWIGLQNCRYNFPISLWENNTDQKPQTILKQQKMFVCIDTGDWIDLGVLLDSQNCYKKLIQHIYIKKNYNTVTPFLEDFLNVLIDIDTDDTEKIITLLFVYDGTVYLPEECEESDGKGPEEIIFGWCRRNWKNVQLNSSIISMAFGVIHANNPCKSKSFDLKGQNSLAQVCREYISWTNVVYDYNCQQLNSNGAWLALWNELVDFSNQVHLPQLLLKK